MARKAYGLHATQVNTGTYADDPAYPIGSNEWNEALDPAGMLGFTPATTNSSTIIIASGVATITDSVSVIAGESATTDTLQKLALTNTSQYDLVYLFAASGSYNITLEHGDLNADGEISTVSGSNETLSTTVPTILMRKGNYWYGYGGGVVNAVSDIGDVTISGIASGELLKWNGSAWINQTLAETGFATSATTDTTNASNISSGTLAAARVATLNQNTTGSSATCSGLAATATALATARTIGGVSFDGTAAINLAGVNTAGTQDTSGTAALATTVTCADNAANETVYPTFVDGATGAQDLETDTGLNYNPSTGLLSAVGLTLSGDLTVSGTTTTLDVTNLAVEDPLIQLAKANAGADTIDIGFWGLYDTSGSTDLRAGLFRDANDSGKWKLFKDTQEDLTSVTAINTGATGYATATLVANIEGAVTGNVTGNASGTALTVTQAAQSAITSVGTLTGLTMGGALAMGGNDITNGGVIFLTEQAESRS